MPRTLIANFCIANSSAGGLLTEADMRGARTPEGLIAWIESLDAAKDYAGVEERLIKAFYEEIRPLGHLARHKYLGRPDFYLRPKIGDQNYDAEMIDRSSGAERTQRIEFTSTYRDYDFALRMEHLAQHGDVYMTGPIGIDGTKASGGRQVQAHLDFVDHQILLDKLMDTCEERVANKLGKDYAAETLLAIVFDDTILYPTDRPWIAQYFRETLSKQALSKFCGVFILGASGRTFWEFGETAPNPRGAGR